MHPANDEMTMGDYARVVARRWWVILILTLAGVGAGLFYASLQSKLYQGSTQVIINQNVPTTASGASSILSRDPERWIDTQAQFALVPQIAQATVRELGLSESPSHLRKRVSVSVDANADILTIHADDPNPQLATRISQAYAHQFVDYRVALDTNALNDALTKLEKQIDTRNAQIARAGKDADPSMRQQVSVLVGKAQDIKELQTFQQSRWVVVDSDSSSSLVRPKRMQTALMGGAAGFLLGVLLVILMQSMDSRARGAAAVAGETGMALLAAVPTPERRVRRKKELSLLVDPRSSNAEGYRKLATAIDFANIAIGARKILLTSAINGEGKSTTAANLAVTYALTGRRVALVDLDLRKPMLSTLLHVDSQPGVLNLGRGDEEKLAGIIRRVELPFSRDEETPGELTFVPAGSGSDDPAAVLASPALHRLLDRLSHTSDVVIIDTPPLLPVNDAIATAALVDAVVLVARSGTVRRPMLREAARLLDSTPAAVLGYVLTASETDETYGTGYYGYAATGGVGKAGD
jgi:tyrosine-protein kinase